MKKALMPLLIIFGVVVLFAAAAYWYEVKYGLNGPFKDSHHHGHEDEHGEEGAVVLPKYKK